MSSNLLDPAERRERVRATCTYWNAARGFGFVRDGEGRDYFVHCSDLVCPSVALCQGQAVSCRPQAAWDGRSRAVSVEALEEVPATPRSGAVDRVSEAGYAFVRGDDGENYFLHAHDCDRPLVEGLRVSFEAIPRRGGDACDRAIRARAEGAR